MAGRSIGHPHPDASLERGRGRQGIVDPLGVSTTAVSAPDIARHNYIHFQHVKRVISLKSVSSAWVGLRGPQPASFTFTPRAFGVDRMSCARIERRFPGVSSPDLAGDVTDHP